MGWLGRSDAAVAATYRAIIRLAYILVPLLGVGCSGSPESEPVPVTEPPPNTVSAPEGPSDCDVNDLSLWTAQVSIGRLSSDSIIRIRNDGAQPCEADLSRSANAGAMMEPDVWIEVGGWADVAITQTGSSCFLPSTVTSGELDINGQVAPIAMAMIASCNWELSALYPAESAWITCGRDPLDVALTSNFVVVRLPDESTACQLGNLVSVGYPTGNDPRHDAIEIRDLAPGDVVAFRYSTYASGDCDRTAKLSTLTFSLGAEISAMMPRCALFQFGAGQPFYGTPSGPLKNMPTRFFDLQAALETLDPFSAP